MTLLPGFPEVGSFIFYFSVDFASPHSATVASIVVMLHVYFVIVYVCNCMLVHSCSS